jgi:two-component system, OmpR family, response regulator CpxR
VEDGPSAAFVYLERGMGPRPVLVVDDDPDIRETLRFVLEDAGYPVYSAENGKEALAILATAERLPGLILLDLMMPVMSGDEMLKALKTVRALAQIPVTIVTASGAPMPPLATGLLKKPVDLDVLLRIVERSCQVLPKRSTS